MDDWKDGRVEGWMSPRRNVNRGYRKLDVWNDAVEYYALTCRIFRGFSYELKRVASNQIAAVDSIHRNIAEGYCRRSVKEYLQFLHVALASAGESVSGLHAYRRSDQISQVDFDAADVVAYKLENGLKRLIESLERKRDAGDWNDSFIVRESNAAYNVKESDPK
jgi:four helix bundle protein